MSACRCFLPAPSRLVTCIIVLLHPFTIIAEREAGQTCRNEVSHFRTFQECNCTMPGGVRTAFEVFSAFHIRSDLGQGSRNTPALRN